MPQVNMETHAGYMAGMQKDFSSCSMPYYATSSEEILFHVATRMTFKLDLKVSYVGVQKGREGGRHCVGVQKGREREEGREVGIVSLSHIPNGTFPHIPNDTGH